MNYYPLNWVDDQEPTLCADNLNHIERGVKTASDSINKLSTRVDGCDSDIATISNRDNSSEVIAFEVEWTAMGR